MERQDSPPKSSGASMYSPLLISMVGVLSSSVALVLYHFVLVRFCLRRQRNAGTEEAQPAEQVPSLTGGVDQKLLQTIPIIAYSTRGGFHHQLFRADQSECVVCLGELEHGEMVRLLPNCKHAFHVPCIDEWFVAHISCPICRSPIVAEAPPALDNDVPTLAPPSPPPMPTLCLDYSYRVELPPENHVQQRTMRDFSGNNVASSSGVNNSPRFSVSSVFPTERTASSILGIAAGLRRSLSLQDQFSVTIDTPQQRDNGREDCSESSSSSIKDDPVDSRTTGPISIKHLDRVSSKLRMSLSRLRVGKNSDILPY